MCVSICLTCQTLKLPGPGKETQDQGGELELDVDVEVKCTNEEVSTAQSNQPDEMGLTSLNSTSGRRTGCTVTALTALGNWHKC